MTRIYKVVGALVGLGLLGYFVHFISRSFDPDALAQLANPHVITAIVAAVALYGLIMPLSAGAWQRLLVVSSGRWSLRSLCGIMALTQLAKYLPGNVAQHASRISLSLAHGMRLRDFVASVTAETLLAVLAGLMVGLVCLAAAGSQGISLANKTTYALWLSVALAGLLIAMPMAIRGVDAFVRKTRWGELWLHWTEAVPTGRTQLLAFSIYCANYLLIGLGFLLIVRALGLGDLSYAELTAAFALSWLAGFFAPGMPAGIGVREGVMALMLGGANAQGEVLSAILAMRLATVGGDLAWFMIGGWLIASAKERSE